MNNFALNAAERVRSKALKEKIVKKIRSSKHQRITFSEFMDMALYEPNLGYYMSAKELIGRGGDFITAPELGDLFGTVLAHKISESLNQLNGPKIIYEFGAGNGRLASQILSQFHKLKIPLDKYVIVEVSPAMKLAQKQAIAAMDEHSAFQVSWYDELPNDGMSGVILANEVLDAMPVELFQLSSNQLHQAYVVDDNGDLRTTFQKHIQKDVLDLFSELDLSVENYDGYWSEIHTHAAAWLRTVADCLNEGTIIICDYGYPQHEYYHRDRNRGTLLCYRKQRVRFDPLDSVGCQDITAHLNFTQLARIATERTLTVNGFTNLEAFVIEFVSKDVDSLRTFGGSPESFKSTSELLALTMSSEMGEIFKVMELTKNFESTNTGFMLSDQRHRLLVQM